MPCCRRVLVNIVSILSVSNKIEKKLFEVYGIDNRILIKICSVVEVIKIRTYSRKTNKLNNVYTIGRKARNISIKKWKIKIVPIIIFFYKTMPIVMDSPSPKRGLQYLRSLTYLTDVQWDISDLPFVQNKDYQY